jgi:hypothetical protein
MWCPHLAHTHLPNHFAHLRAFAVPTKRLFARRMNKTRKWKVHRVRRLPRFHQNSRLARRSFVHSAQQINRFKGFRSFVAPTNKSRTAIPASRRVVLVAGKWARTHGACAEGQSCLGYVRGGRPRTKMRFAATRWQAPRSQCPAGGQTQRGFLQEMPTNQRRLGIPQFCRGVEASVSPTGENIGAPFLSDARFWGFVQAIEPASRPRTRGRARRPILNKQMSFVGLRPGPILNKQMSFVGPILNKQMSFVGLR